MSRATILIAAVFLCLAISSNDAMSQVGRELDKRTKDAQSAQEKSWQQVDQINKETDRTNARLQQARQSGTTATQKSGYSVKKTGISTRSPYQKFKSRTAETTKKGKTRH